MIVCIFATKITCIYIICVVLLFIPVILLLHVHHMSYILHHILLFLSHPQVFLFIPINIFDLLTVTLQAETLPILYWERGTLQYNDTPTFS